MPFNSVTDTDFEWRLATWEEHGKRLYSVVKCFIFQGEYSGFAPPDLLDDFLTHKDRAKLADKMVQLTRCGEKPVIDLDRFPDIYLPRYTNHLPNYDRNQEQQVA